MSSNSKKLNLEKIQSKIEDNLSEVKNIIESSLKEDGLKSEDSQKVYVLMKLVELERAINGIEISDLK